MTPLAETYFFIWDEHGNVAHLAEHGVTPEEAIDVIERASPQDRSRSRSSDKPIVFGMTRNGRHLIVVYEQAPPLTTFCLPLAKGNIQMAKNIYKRMPDAFRERVRQDIEKFEREELPEVMERAQRFFEQQERLQQTLAALKAERQAQKLSLTEMQRRTGISKPRLSRLENDPNANPTINTLSRIAEALGREVVITLVPAA